MGLTIFKIFIREGILSDSVTIELNFLGSYCLQKLSADDTSRWRINVTILNISRFSLNELTSRADEAVPSTMGIVEEEAPKWSDRHFDDTDFKSKMSLMVYFFHNL